MGYSVKASGTHLAIDIQVYGSIYGQMNSNAYALFLSLLSREQILECSVKILWKYLLETYILQFSVNQNML